MSMGMNILTGNHIRFCNQSGKKSRINEKIERT